MAVLDAPSNLGLRPPSRGTVPGCYKLPGALRDAGLLRRLGALDAGCVTPPRYDRGSWVEGDGVFNAAAIAEYSGRLAGRIGALTEAGAFPLVLGGDCSILLGAMLYLRRRGRYGLAFLDGHSDFRHPGNSGAIGAAAGEDLALVTGRGQSDLTSLDQVAPLVQDTDVAVVGVRESDEYLPELRSLNIYARSVGELRSEGVTTGAARALRHLERDELGGFWVHLDVDILDPTVMPAVDSPDPGGLQHAELVELLRTLVASNQAVGMDVTVFDPDLDPDRRFGLKLTETLVVALAARRG